MIKSLYVHIPFCLKKCLYCDFNSYSDLGLQDEYIEALLSEIDSLNIKEIETIFIGGGTPTALSYRNMEKVLGKLAPLRPKEFTIEANPGTLNETKLELMKNYGVNRISIGLQAWQDSLLKRLGRIHSLKDFLNNFESARGFGFNNINVDLMFGLPGQTMEDWNETLKNVVDLRPEHISAYGLIIEEGTPFYEIDSKGLIKLPDEDLEREMYDTTAEFLKASGYRHYEISNYSLEGYECRHNITYWRDEEYYGVGAGAHSYVSGKRISNKRSIGIYIDGIKASNYKEEENIVTVEDGMAEFMFLGLRMMAGVSVKKFKERFGLNIYDAYPGILEELEGRGLLKIDGDCIKLTEFGISVSNQVFVSFIK